MNEIKFSDSLNDEEIKKLISDATALEQKVFQVFYPGQNYNSKLLKQALTNYLNLGSSTGSAVNQLKNATNVGMVSNIITQYLTNTVLDSFFGGKSNQQIQQIVQLLLQDVDFGSLPQDIVSLHGQYKQQSGLIQQLLAETNSVIQHNLEWDHQNQTLLHNQNIILKDSTNLGKDLLYDFIITDTTQQNLDLYFESKSGIKNYSPTVSEFDFGKFSTNAFNFRSADYEALIDDLNDSLRQLINKIIENTAGATGQRIYNDDGSIDIRLSTTELAKMFVIKYIVWRLRDNIPFFIDRTQVQGVLLCSEVLTYMDQHKKAYITETFFTNPIIKDAIIEVIYKGEREVRANRDVIEKKLKLEALKFNIKLGYGRYHN